MKLSMLGSGVTRRVSIAIGVLLAVAQGAYAQADFQRPEPFRPGLRVDGQPLELERKPQVDPAARALMDQIEGAYKNLKSISLSGDFVVSVTSTGKVHKVAQPFTASYEQPNKFRHEMRPDVLVGCDGKNGYVYDQKQNAFLRFNFPTSKGPAQRMPMGLLSTLLLQDPSLLFAMTDTRISDVLTSFGDAKRVPDAMVDGVSCPVLQFGNEGDANRVRLFVDPKTHLVRRFVLDLKSSRDPMGNPTGADASVAVNYREVKPQEAFAARHFAWTPPAGATDVLEAAGAESKEEQKPEARPQRPGPDSFQNYVVP